MAPVSTDLLDGSFVGGSFGQKHTPMTLGVTGAIYSATTLNISKQVPASSKIFRSHPLDLWKLLQAERDLKTSFTTQDLGSGEGPWLLRRKGQLGQ